MARQGPQDAAGSDRADQKSLAAAGRIDLLSFAELRVESVNLRLRIEEARRRYDLPRETSRDNIQVEQGATGDHLNPEQHND